jgi:hypothetical protein
LPQNRAALWSIRPALLAEFPDLPFSETAIAAHFARVDLRLSPVVQGALSEVLRLTANLCRLLFPDRVILTGPFVQNPEIFSRFVETVDKAPMLRSLDKVRARTGRRPARCSGQGRNRPAPRGPLDPVDQNVQGPLQPITVACQRANRFAQFRTRNRSQFLNPDDPSRPTKLDHRRQPGKCGKAASLAQGGDDARRVDPDQIGLQINDKLSTGQPIQIELRHPKSF